VGTFGDDLCGISSACHTRRVGRRIGGHQVEIVLGTHRDDRRLRLLGMPRESFADRPDRSKFSVSSLLFQNNLGSSIFSFFSQPALLALADAVVE
jgi:hypothetical protein